MALAIHQDNIAQDYIFKKDSTNQDMLMASVEENIFSTSEIDIGNNKCDDGVDDGEISTFSKIANVAEGVFNIGKNIALTAFKYPTQTLIGIGACFLPVVGPAVATGLTAFGLYSGIKEVKTGIDIAKNSTTDAQTKVAWENIGSGSTTALLSAFGLKESAGLLKTHISGATKTISTVNKITAFMQKIF